MGKIMMNHQIRGFQTLNTSKSWQTLHVPPQHGDGWWLLGRKAQRRWWRRGKARWGQLRCCDVGWELFPHSLHIETLGSWSSLMFGRIQHSDHTHTQYISLYLYIYLYNSLYTSPYLHVQSFPPHWLTILIRRSFPSWHVYFKIPQMSHDVLRIIGH